MPQYCGLGYCPEGYTPDHLDYSGYVTHCDHFLRSAAGCAALLVGGIVACLAYKAVGYDLVIAGPSDNVYKTGWCYWDGQRSLQGLWDDMLTEDETDTICGVYRVSTGMPKWPPTTDLSWWPKPSIWNECGLVVGYWSSDCKSWFQRCIEKLRAGVLVLKNPKDWHHSLRFIRDAARIAKSNETLAAESVSQLFSQ
ncbi:hypothetical protein BDQ12DRAFT_618659 [Crucibulum laeve]|uniref:Uncharacterized protein n=1 Tax=Crucibulum laeve TaxID=68775 RepID=A0A5C3LG47_9AGAR|nr:hypothetical protein BDQ12DRAFT_618659 [Crucibulum laeve]